MENKNTVRYRYRKKLNKIVVEKLTQENDKVRVESKTLPTPETLFNLLCRDTNNSHVSEKQPKTGTKQTQTFAHELLSEQPNTPKNRTLSEDEKRGLWNLTK